VRSTQKPLKVSLFGHFRHPEFRNDGTLLAIVSRLQALSPDGEFRCICCYPEAVVARDGIEGLPITTRAPRGVPNRDSPLVRRVLMAFVGVGAELRQYARAFRELKGTEVLIFPGGAGD
jgi:polysaccharide pyruvyl transferase WcaK-like protein